MKKRVTDIPLLLIGVSLAVTLMAFFAGLFPYPYGWIVLSVLLVGRWLSLQGPNGSDSH